MTSKTTIYCLNNPDKYEVYRETNRVKCKTRYDNNEEYRQHKIEYAKNRYRLMKEQKANNAMTSN